MEHNDTVMKEWKEELQQLKMSGERYKKIEQAIEEAPKKRWSPVVIISPVVIAIVLVLFFTGMPGPANTTTATDGLRLQPLSGLVIGWASAANLFAVINYVLMIAVVINVRRIQHVPLFEAFKKTYE